MINVILADPQKHFRIGLASVLAAEDDIRIVGQPYSLALLLHALHGFRAQVLVLSSAYLGQLNEIRTIASPQRTSILFLAEPEDSFSALFPADVQGVVQRLEANAAIVRCVRHLAQGGEVPPTGNEESAAAPPDAAGIRVRQRLSFDELRIAAFVAQGYRNHEIALRMETTEQAVKESLRRVFDKTGVYDRLELALFMLHHNSTQRDTAAGLGSRALNSMPAIQSFRSSRARTTIN